MTKMRVADALDLTLLGFAVLLSVAGLIAMVTMARTGAAMAGVSIYGGALIVTYTNAALYHGYRTARASAILQALDHATIFLLIAGTYTPFCLLALPNHHGRILLALVWGMAAVGIGIRLLWARRAYRWAPLLYLAQGWIGIPWTMPLVDTVGKGALFFIVAGGIAYTAGIAFFLWRSFRYGNAVWHGFVIAGSACHFIAVTVYLLPYHARLAGF